MNAKLLDFLAPAKPSGRGMLLFWISLVLAAGIIIATMAGGIRRGMDHVAVYGPEGEQTAIAIALSESVYGLKAGYIGYASVRAKLVSIWNRGATSGHDPILIENNKNAALLEEALVAASTMGPQQPGYVGDGSLFTTVYDDIGYVDFIKLSFRLFGIHFTSMYYTFFLLVSLSSLIFLVTFRNDVIAQGVLLAILFSFFIEMHTAIYIPDMPTFFGQRHGSTLGLLPMWYFVFLVIRRYPMLSIVRSNWRMTLTLWWQEWRGIAIVIASVFQLAILILAMKTRGSAMWMVVFVLAVGLGVGLIRWLSDDQARRRWIDLARMSACWPAILLAVGVFAHAQYSKSILHPIYFTDDVTPYHGLWHSAYIGFQYRPELMSGQAAEIFAKQGPSDIVGYTAAIEYMDRIRFIQKNADILVAPATFVSPWTHTYKNKLHDEMMHRLVLETLRKHPFKALQLYFIDKPFAHYGALRAIYLRTDGYLWLLLTVGGGLIGAALIWAGGVRCTKEVAFFYVLIVAAIPFSALPTMWAYPSFHTVADLLLTVLISMQATVCSLGLLLAILFFSRRERSPSRVEAGIDPR